MVGATCSFEKYLEDVETLVLSPDVKFQQTLDTEPLLNGKPYQIYRQSFEVDDRRGAGAFFSGNDISAQLVAALRDRTPSGSIVMDPTCGIGDLLLAYARCLPIETTLEGTLAHWGRLLIGIDRQPELVLMTKLRIILLARYRGQFTDQLSSVDKWLPQIVVGDMFDEQEAFRNVDGFLFNPPFGQASHRQTVDWGSGIVNSAAVFLDHLIQTKDSEAPIAAILPEVLRCGTRYKKFRSHLNSLGVGGTYSSLGRFDSWADVDVFLTILTSHEQNALWSLPSGSAPPKCVGDFFDVCVGPVVPHRHEEKGPLRKYVCAKTVPLWNEGYLPKTNRKFQGTIFDPPFVVVRRTSSPSDRKRAVGSVVAGNQRVAVENHLLVVKPKDDSLQKCHLLLEVLNQSETTDHLNKVIRCRHLTTESVANIPWSITDV